MWLRKRKINDENYYSIVHSYRENEKIKQKTVLSLGTIETAYERLKEYPQYSHFLHELRGERTQQKYKTILADPPWLIGNKGGGNRRVDRHYPLMSTEEITSLSVKDIADDNAHLYLWVTNNALQDGFKVIESWDFEYITMITWVKDKMGLGQYYRGQTEHCLFAKRGNLPFKKDLLTEQQQRGQTLIHEVRKRHTEKPKQIYEIIERVSFGPYLELFARKRANSKWDIWGNEVDSDIDITKK